MLRRIKVWNLTDFLFLYVTEVSNQWIRNGHVIWRRYVFLDFILRQYWAR